MNSTILPLFIRHRKIFMVKNRCIMLVVLIQVTTNLYNVSYYLNMSLPRAEFSWLQPHRLHLSCAFSLMAFWRSWTIYQSLIQSNSTHWGCGQRSASCVWGIKLSASLLAEESFSDSRLCLYPLLLLWPTSFITWDWSHGSFLSSIFSFSSN